ILENSNPFLTQVPFNIRLRTPEDIVVVGRPSYLNVRNLVILLGILLLAVIAAGVRGWILERKIRRQTAAMARRTEAEAVLERRRSRILEDINGSRPLAEIVEQIVSLASVRLEGARCWCEI